MATQTLIRLTMTGLQYLGKGTVMQIMFAAKKKIPMTETTLEVGGERVLASRHRLLEGLLTDGIFQRNDGGIGGSNLLLNTRILRTGRLGRPQQEKQ